MRSFFIHSPRRFSCLNTLLPASHVQKQNEAVGLTWSVLFYSFVRTWWRQKLMKSCPGCILNQIKSVKSGGLPKQLLYLGFCAKYILYAAVMRRTSYFLLREWVLTLWKNTGRTYPDIVQNKVFIATCIGSPYDGVDFLKYVGRMSICSFQTYSSQNLKILYNGHSFCPKGIKKWKMTGM